MACLQTWNRLTDHTDRRDGYPPREQLPLPTQPPYTAHIGNMSFDATQGDVSDFFRDCEVTNVRIVEDKMDHRPKGFGYVEFGSLEGLKKALSYNGNQLGGRAIRISVADPRKS
jgi:translation initiation factor 4B